MHPHPALSLALMAEFERERASAARRARLTSPRTPRLRAARSRRAAARALPAGC